MKEDDVAVVVVESCCSRIPLMWSQLWFQQHQIRYVAILIAVADYYVKLIVIFFRVCGRIKYLILRLYL
jgi:hypothetical protein